MGNYPNAGKGLRIMYVSAIGVVVCGVLSVVPLLGLLFGIAMIVFSIMDFVGYYHAAKDIMGCRVAFIFRIISILMTLMEGPLEDPGFIYSLVNEIMAVAAVCLVFTSVSKILREHGVRDLAKKGIIAMWIYLIFTFVSYFADIVAAVLLLSLSIGGALVVLLVQLTLSILTLVYQLKFYKKSAEEFGVYF